MLLFLFCSDAPPQRDCRVSKKSRWDINKYRLFADMMRDLAPRDAKSTQQCLMAVSWLTVAHISMPTRSYLHGSKHAARARKTRIILPIPAASIAITLSHAATCRRTRSRVKVRDDFHGMILSLRALFHEEAPRWKGTIKISIAYTSREASYRPWCF